MLRSPVQFEGITYKYILTVHDVLSRYIWLRPLTGKSSKLVAEAKELHKLYCEVGPPKVLQCDNGGEFKKAVANVISQTQREDNQRLSISPTITRQG